MPQLLALEWDGNEARVVLARTRGRDAVIEDAFTIDLQAREAGQNAAAHVGARLAAELTARNIGRVELLVAVGRKDIELRLLNVPPAPPEELPEVVRFQALRQFSSLGEDWPLDFVPLAAKDEIPTSVLAATLAPEQVKQIRAACEVASLTPRRMVLRPMAAASLLSHQLPDERMRCRLMIDMLSDEADLTVLVGEQVVFLRTCRLPGDSEPAAQSALLINEIRRTMVAAQNQLGGQRVEYVIVCGNPADHTELLQRLGRELSLRIECFDPFAALPISDQLRTRLPSRHGRFAPLLGMLVDEAAGTPHAIDFLNPRRRPPPPDRRRQRWLLAGAAGTLAAAVCGYVYFEFATLSSELRDRTKELADIEKLVKPSQQKIKHAQEIEKFVHSDITWLDELHRLSDTTHFPAAEDAIVTHLNAAAREPHAGARDAHGGTLTVEGVVRDPKVIERMEASLRDPRHAVAGTGSRSDPSGQSYAWKFKETVTVTHPDVDLPTSKPKATAAPTNRAPVQAEATR
jgi:Tfp pilus assembly PilM family ATPase